MLNRKTFTPLPTVSMVAILALLVIGLTDTQVVGQAPGPAHIQSLPVVPAQYPGAQYPGPQYPGAQYPGAQYPGYNCGPACQPNFRDWGYCPTTWRQWPQRRPDIWFPEGVGREQLPTPVGTKPIPLPKEETFISPIAPQPGSFLPPIGEGPATGPGDLGTPFQLEPGFDQGSGFDQGLPGMENLPTQPPAADSLQIEGTNDSGALPPPGVTPAEIPPTTGTPPAPVVPAPNKDSAIAVPDSSVLTFQPQAPLGLNVAMAAEVRPSSPLLQRPRQARPTEPQLAEIQPLEAQLARTQPAPFEPTKEEALAPLSVAPEPMSVAPHMNKASVGEPLVQLQRATFEPVRQTVFEAPAEPWAVPKSWKSQRSREKSPLPKYSDRQIVELQQPQSRQAMPVQPRAETPTPPEPQELKKAPAESVSVGLEGYCPVNLVRNETWTLGDSRFAVEFEGRTYLMSGPAQHRAFRSNPERFAPANAGYDPVLSFEENSRQPGLTDSCAVFEGRLYMFANTDSLARFQANPQRYTRALRKPRN